MEIIENEELLLEQHFEEEIIKMGALSIPENEIKKEESIGEGAFGKVYKGKYKDNIVAIKKIKLEEKSQEIFDSLLNEIKVIHKAQNADIPKFYGIMKRKGHYNLIFEFIPGNTLKDIYPQLTYLQKLNILISLCTILENFHKKHLIHRDIKPGNIMITENMIVKLIDFGISKIAQHTCTFTNAQIGTIPYMSPEQFQIDLDRFSNPNVEDIKPVPISIYSDIWSVGVMTSEIFSNIKPYYNISKKYHPNPQMITRRLIGNKPFPIPKELDENIKIIVEKATNVQVEKRVNASELKELFIKLKEKNENESNKNIINNNNNNNKYNNDDNNDKNNFDKNNENINTTKENTNLFANNDNNIKNNNNGIFISNE